jgi:hypothetical protein
MHKITALASYDYARTEHSRRKVALAKELRISVTELPAISTIDGDAGEENVILILDLVTDKGNGPKELGFISENGRATVAITRGRGFMYMFRAKAVVHCRGHQMRMRAQMSGMSGKVGRQRFGG